ncbi:MAG: DNA mismatch repair endonuclease MutL [Clostridia bacterium]|nr:DNA mismatch repair endonuclease MutL [Clostridia bacterium]
MSLINILDSKIYNRISAGEVVERPASVIKELMENSIDAGCKNLLVEISGGGIKQIKVVDDGQGIMFEDVKKVFLSHATSKISKAEDLENISTLGFRGEALASISAVSQVTLFSKYFKSEVGEKITVNGGIIEEPVEYGAKMGTTIIVDNLFFNTPVRLKFLKSEKQEENAITNIVSRLIFANPNLSIKYIADGKTIYNSSLLGLKEKIFNVYGKETVENIVSVQGKNETYSLSGFISKPTFCKANRTYQTLIINGRYVTNFLLSTAVQNAYENFLMKGKFPLFVLNLTVPLDEIDVNVHPSKMEVKFRNSNKIFGFIYSLILETLNDSNFSVFYQNTNYSLENQLQKNSIQDKTQTPQTPLNEVKNGFSFGNMKEFSDSLSKINIANPTFKKDYGIGVLASNDNSIENDNFKYSKSVDFSHINDENKVFSTRIEQEKFDKSISYKIIGTIFNTYLAIESSDNFYLFDQHAGHERVLFDKFMKLYEEKKLNSQPLLLPYIFDVNNIEKTLIEDNINVFFELGFQVEQFGNNSYKISAVPSILTDINLENFLLDALQNLSKISSTNEVIKKHFATCACKAAVKGGQVLSDNEITFLLGQILSSKYTLLCPHGRPICVSLSKYEVEKMFKRIV